MASIPLPNNSALVIDLVSMGTVAVVTVQTCTRKGTGNPRYDNRTFGPTAAGLLSEFVYQLSDDELMWYSISCTADSTGVPPIARVSLSQFQSNAFVPLATLSVGAVYALPVHGWRGEQTLLTFDERFPLVTGPISNPVAGNPQVTTFSNVDVQCEWAFAQLATSAAVANRIVQVHHRTSAGVIIEVNNGTLPQAASSTLRYSWRNLGQVQSQGGQDITQCFAPMKIVSGEQLAIIVSSIDAADQLSNVRYGIRLMQPALV